MSIHTIFDGHVLFCIFSFDVQYFFCVHSFVPSVVGSLLFCVLYFFARFLILFDQHTLSIQCHDVLMLPSTCILLLTFFQLLHFQPKKNNIRLACSSILPQGSCVCAKMYFAFSFNHSQCSIGLFRMREIDHRHTVMMMMMQILSKTNVENAKMQRVCPGINFTYRV